MHNKSGFTQSACRGGPWGPRGVTDPYNLTPSTNYYTDAANTGTVAVTRFDTVARVAGGTFAYTARAATGHLVHVTNG